MQLNVTVLKSCEEYTMQFSKQECSDMMSTAGVCVSCTDLTEALLADAL